MSDADCSAGNEQQCTERFCLEIRGAPARRNKRSLKELEAELGRTKRALASLQGSFEEKLEADKGVRAKVARRERNAEAYGRVAELERKCEALRDQARQGRHVRSLREERANLEATLASRDAEIARLKNEAAGAQKVAAAKARQQSELQKAAERIQKEKENRETEIQQLRRDAKASAT
eukprot:6209373-Pleurochrysis_carterae.AAC.1